MTLDLKSHIERQRAFSQATFGPGERTKGVCDHIEKELKEIQKEETPYNRALEWVDVVALALDGATRALEEDGLDASNELPRMIREKQRIVERRNWPDWRTMSQDEAIEHIR